MRIITIGTMSDHANSRSSAPTRLTKTTRSWLAAGFSVKKFERVWLGSPRPHEPSVGHKPRKLGSRLFSGGLRADGGSTTSMRNAEERLEEKREEPEVGRDTASFGTTLSLWDDLVKRALNDEVNPSPHPTPAVRPPPNSS